MLEADELLQEGIAVTGQVAHAHQFDKTQLVATGQAVLEQRHHLIEVLSAQRHHVDLDFHPGRAGLLHAIEHSGQVATTGNTPESIRIKGIEGNVEAADTGRTQQWQFARQ
ncbi:hypothetical protein D3C76_1039340 [compost metagenome]